MSGNNPNTDKCEKYVKDLKYVDEPLIKNYSIIMPYINEISNLLTITLFKPYFNFELYPHSTNTVMQIIKKNIIDLLALSGIVTNSVKETDNENPQDGILMGILYIIFSFVVPNLFMRPLLNIANKIFKKRAYINLTKFAFGSIFIILIELTVNAIFDKLKKD